MRNRTTAEHNFLVDYLRSTNTRLKAGADDGILTIIEYGLRNNYSIALIAYAVATSGHETAYWYQPIREGATRSGPKFTDAQAIAAVVAAMNRGIIKQNYVKKINGRSYYGRGLVQITWLDNYKKYEDLTGKPLVANPDLALDWQVALFILYDGIANGRFREGKRFSLYVPDGTVPTQRRMQAARDIINGDTRTVGPKLGREAMEWYTVLTRHADALKPVAAKQMSFGSYIMSFLKGFKR
jgi:hypothetical protein